jgi:hypothetical protein
VWSGENLAKDLSGWLASGIPSRRFCPSYPTRRATAVRPGRCRLAKPPTIVRATPRAEHPRVRAPNTCEGCRRPLLLVCAAARRCPPHRGRGARRSGRAVDRARAGGGLSCPGGSVGAWRNSAHGFRRSRTRACSSTSCCSGAIRGSPSRRFILASVAASYGRRWSVGSPGSTTGVAHEVGGVHFFPPEPKVKLLYQSCEHLRDWCAVAVEAI